MITLVWFVATAVLIIFIMLRGWRGLSIWQRRYVCVALVTVPTLEILNRLKLPNNKLVEVTAIIIGTIYIITIWWGVVIGLMLMLELTVRRAKPDRSISK
jgi:hypothetical protein